MNFSRTCEGAVLFFKNIRWDRAFAESWIFLERASAPATTTSGPPGAVSKNPQDPACQPSSRISSRSIGLPPVLSVSRFRRLIGRVSIIPDFSGLSRPISKIFSGFQASQPSQTFFKEHRTFVLRRLLRGAGFLLYRPFRICQALVSIFPNAFRTRIKLYNAKRVIKYTSSPTRQAHFRLSSDFLSHDPLWKQRQASKAH